MKKLAFSALFLIFILVSLVCGQSNSWKSLIPLHSTRADVEKLFGKSESEECFYCSYETPTEKISVDYSNGKCKDGWNVPQDTVISLSVSATADVGKSFEDLKLDKSKYSLSTDDAFYGKWTNAEQGLQYDFVSVERELQSITYLPKKSDNNLRCDGFPPFAPDARYFTMERYPFQNESISKTENIYRIYGLLDMIISNINNETDYQGYALIYFDKKLPLREYRARINKIKDFAFKRRKLPAAKMLFIEGGLREEVEIEFYILPKDRKPPAPDPSFPSPQFMK